MLKKRAWLIPVNAAILFGLLCFWAVESHDTVWAVVDMIFCLINAFFAYRWLSVQRARR